MTGECVLLRVLGIANMRGNAKAAHDAERDLWLDVLLEIAMGHPEAEALAHAAIHTTDIV